ncbi:hypothetical protein [Nannocystis bainbridge]|uniref:Uncharacterized protein n=1 Tax=Nannocystis bainbridge TaxID=2995303 RepID=A0ABT5E445_9BACT|nr:hypothetical protein [Nannocystis bainbridge]MDC0720644.1 hypothetical protein [Nannocystis bainbridge]
MAANAGADDHAGVPSTPASASRVFQLGGHADVTAAHREHP